MADDSWWANAPLADAGAPAAPSAADVSGTPTPSGVPRITVTPNPDQPSAPPLDDIQKDMLVRTVLGEAAAEPHEGKAAVAAVIKNRLASGKFGATPADVVLAKNQFEPWSTPAGRGRMMSYGKDSPEYGDASAAVDRVFGDEGYDPTEGATHFYSPTAQAALGRAPPKWAQGDPTVIGRHNFYAPNGRVQQASVAPDAPQPPVNAPAPSPDASEASGNATAADDWWKAAPVATPQEAGVDMLKKAFAKGQKPNTDDLRRAGARPQDAGQEAQKGVSGQFFKGVPVLGAYVDQAGGAVSAAAQPLTGVGAPGDTFGERYAENVANEKADREGFEKENPKVSTAANIAGGVAALAPLGGTAIGARALGITGPNVAARLGASVASNSAIGAADSAARGDSIAGGAASGAVAGVVAPAIGGIISRVLRPVGATGGATREAMVDTLRNEGVVPTAGQATGSKALRYSEGALGEMPGAGRGAADLVDQQGEAFTRAALRRAGTNAPRATPDVMQATADRIGNQFETLSARNTMRMDPQFARDIGATLREYDRVLPSQQREVVNNFVDDILAHGNQMPGTAYQEARSRLSRLANNARQSDPTYGEALGGIRDALDAAMNRSISPADRAAWGTARREYGNMKVLEKAISGAGENSALGLISPSQLRTAVATRNRGAYARGQGDLTELARAGEAVLKPLPNSGTASRLMASQLLTHGVGGLVGGVAGAHSDAGVIPGAVAGALAPGLAGRALLSRPMQAYLGNRMVSAQQAEALRALLAGGGANPIRQQIDGPSRPQGQSGAR